MGSSERRSKDVVVSDIPTFSAENLQKNLKVIQNRSLSHSLLPQIFSLIFFFVKKDDDHFFLVFFDHVVVSCFAAGPSCLLLLESLLELLGSQAWPVLCFTLWWCWSHHLGSWPRQASQQTCTLIHGIASFLMASLLALWYTLYFSFFLHLLR